MLNLTQPTSNPKKPGTMTTFLAPKSIPTKPMAETSLTSCRPFPLLAPALLESVPKPPSNTLPSELLWEIQPDTVGKWVIELAIAMMLLQFQMAFFELERCERRLLSSLRCSPFWDHCNSDAVPTKTRFLQQTANHPGVSFHIHFMSRMSTKAWNLAGNAMGWDEFTKCSTVTVRRTQSCRSIILQKNQVGNWIV